MKCLVTGGRGFIGSHLVDRLAGLDHEVWVVDSGSRQDWDRRGVYYSMCSVSDLAYINRGGGIDWVFHLAALTDIIPSIERPVAYYKANVEGTVTLLDWSVRTGIQKFIFASSTSVYGIPSVYPTPETYPPDPRYPYALTKLLAEQSVLHWGKVYRMPMACLRPTTVYGPRMKSSGYGGAFKVFMAQRAHGAPFTVTDPSFSRDFVYVSDVVEAFVKAAKSDKEGVYNVGYGEPRPIGDLIEILGGGETVPIPPRPAEPNMTWADIGKIQADIGWSPRVSLEDGVAVMLEHLDDWKEARVWTPETTAEATREWFRWLS